MLLPTMERYKANVDMNEWMTESNTYGDANSDRIG